MMAPASFAQNLSVDQQFSIFSLKSDLQMTFWNETVIDC